MSVVLGISLQNLCTTRWGYNTTLVQFPLRQTIPSQLRVTHVDAGGSERRYSDFALLTFFCFYFHFDHPHPFRNTH